MLLRIKLDDRTLLPPPRAEMIVLGASASMITLLFIRSLYLLALHLRPPIKCGGRYGGESDEGVGISMVFYLYVRALADYFLFSSAYRRQHNRNTV